MIKLYTNPTCHYCHKIKEQLVAGEIKFEEVDTTQAGEEWNELVRITGIGMTPTVILQEETLLPNRDFRTAEDLIGRIKHFTDNPMKRLSIDEKLEQMHNSVKNLTLLLNQMGRQMTELSSQATPTPPTPPMPPTPPVPPQ
jgi:glutaredoxin